MHARYQGSAIHSQGKQGQVSPSRMLTILSNIPRDKPKVIIGLRNDLKDIEEELIQALASAIQANIRIYGNMAITDSLPKLLEGSGDYDIDAHNAYMASVAADHPIFLRSSDVRRMYEHFDFGDGMMIKLLQLAVQRVSKTPDEPQLVVKPHHGDTSEIVVSFAAK